jgi:hypothetical protein
MSLLHIIMTLGQGGSIAAPPPPVSLTQIIGDGDSLSQHGGVNHWLHQLSDPSRLGTTAYGDFTTYAISGQYVSDILADAATQIKGAINHTTYTRTKLFVLIGRNNYMNTAGVVGVAVSQIQQYIAAVTDANTDVYLLTVPAANIATFYGEVYMRQFQSKFRTDWHNQYLRDNWASLGAAGFIDLARDTRLQDPTNRTYFGTDDVHNTDAGRTVIADVVSAYVKTGAQPTGPILWENASWITFPASSDTVEVRTGSREWRLMTGTTVVANQTLAAGVDGSITIEHTEGFSLSGMHLGFDTVSTANAPSVSGTAQWAFVANFQGDILNAGQSGGAMLNTGITPSRPASFRYKRVSGVISIEQTTNGVDWTTIYTFPTANNAKLYFKAKSDYPTNSVILYPKTTGWA